MITELPIFYVLVSLHGSDEKFELIRKEGLKTESEGKYYHWDILRHLIPLEGLTAEELK